MEVSQLSGDALTQPVRQTLYNSTNNHSELQYLDNMQFVAKKRRSLPGGSRKHIPVNERPSEEAETYPN